MVIRDEQRRRTTNRAEDFDYSQPGSYYVTVCTHRLTPMFGGIVDGEMRLNDFGRIVEDEWYRTAMLRPNVDLDAFVVMPNHFHGIIVLNEIETLVRATGSVALGPAGADSLEPETFVSPAAAAVPAAGATEPVARTQSAKGPSANSLGAIIGQIKSTSTKGINRLRKTPGAPVWHRNYYDHINRNEKDMDRVRAYILDNPINWQYDRANPIVRTGDRLGRPAQHQPTIRETLTL